MKWIVRLFLPKWLIEMSRQMNEQPNRCTAHPFWQVRYKNWIPAAEQYGDEFEIWSSDGDRVYASHSCNKEEAIEYLLEYHFDWCRGWCKYNDIEDYETINECFNDRFDIADFHEDLPDDLNRLMVVEQEEIATTHLTEVDAKWFIKRKQHDYPPLYTYVESAYWSPQLRELQDWLISLSK